MQISKQELKQIINEEIDIAIEEGKWDQFKATASGLFRGTGAARKSVGARAAAMKRAALGQGGEVDAAGKAGAIKGKYAYGKKVKIIDLHKKKIEQVFKDAQAKLTKRIDDMEDDLKALGLEDSAGAQKIIANLRDVAVKSAEAEVENSNKMGALLQAVASGEMTQEE
jgi:hypothetical protein